MKPSTYRAISHERNSAADNTSGSVKTFTIPKSTSAVLLTAETTAARFTLDGTDPSAASAPSLVLPTGIAPVLIPVGPGTVLKHVSTAGAPSVLHACYLA